MGGLYSLYYGVYNLVPSGPIPAFTTLILNGTAGHCIMPPVIGYAACHSSGLRNRHDISFRA